MHRKQFLKLAALSTLSAYLPACHDTEIKKAPPGATAPTPDSKPPTPNTPVNLLRKGDPLYDTYRQGFNKRIDKYPAAIALCTSTEEVAAAVRYAVANNLVISIKSGGHSFEGFSVNNDGLQINLSKMNTIEWTGPSEICVGPGCTLAGLYAEILPKGKLLPAGSCGGVGIGGLTLGGGYGLFSREYGLTCDSLTEVTMVDGSGKVISSKDDPQLLWACKGGGNGNFGVITRMKFALQPIPAFLKCTRFSTKKVDTATARVILEKWFELTRQLPPSCFSAFVLNRSNLYILLTNTAEESEEVKEFTQQLSSLVERTTHTQQASFQKGVQVFYGVQHHIFFKNASAGLYDSFADIAPIAEEVIEQIINTRGMIYQVNTLGGKIMDPQLEAASSFPHRKKRYLSELQCYWQQEKNTSIRVESFEKIQRIFLDHGIKAQYCNYPDLAFQNWKTAYYGDNYARLQQVKKKYDPNNVIRHEQSIL